MELIRVWSIAATCLVMRRIACGMVACAVVAVSFAQTGGPELVQLSPYAVDSHSFVAPHERTDARSGVLIETDVLQSPGIERLEDVFSFVPGAVTAPLYGIAGVPIIRGDLGDVAQNGQRKTYNRNAFPISLNALEAIDIVSGPAPLPVGYSNGTGGFANFRTKKARLNETFSDFLYSVGSWGRQRWQMDVNRAMTQRLAVRASVERIQGDSFYRLVSDDSWDVFVAATWQPRTGMSWNASVEAYRVSFVENPGTNRPTQALVDRGEYIAGTSIGTGGSYFGNTFTPSGTVAIDGSPVLVAPGDAGFARIYTAQVTGTLEGATRTITSRSYFESGEGEKAADYGFYSFFPRARTFEQRLEFSERHGRHSLDWGMALRAEERLSFVDFFNEPVNAYDLTGDVDALRLPTTEHFGVRPVRGRPGRFAVSGARYGAAPFSSVSQTLHSQLLSGGLFFEDRMAIGHQWEVRTSARVDALHVRSEDPLPAAGFEPVRDSLKSALPAGSLSVLRRFEPLAGEWTSLMYVTASRAAAVEASSGTGGFGLTGNRLAADLFENGNQLLEVGFKWNDAASGATLNLAGYSQRRTRTNARLGVPDEIEVSGVEAQGSLDRFGLRFSGHATYADANYRNGPLPGSISTVPYFDPALPTTNFGSYPRGDYRLPGIPRWFGALRIETTQRLGAGVRLAAKFQGSQNLDLFGHVRIPRQHSFDAEVFWRGETWEMSCAFFNVTDEFNWRPTSTPFAGADLITRELPRHFRLSVRKSFR